jgi:hypothetical protein
MSNHWNPYRPDGSEPKLVFHPASVIPKLRLESFDTASAEYKKWKAIKDSAGNATVRVFNQQYPNKLKIFDGTPEQQFLTSLRFAQMRKFYLGNVWSARFIAKAWERGDKRFFIRLGSELAKAPMTSETAQRHKLREFLVTNWSGSDPKMPDLCFFTDEALTALCRIALGNDRLTFVIVRHERQRLDLKQAEHLIHSVVRKSEKVLCVKVAKKVKH